MKIIEEFKAFAMRGNVVDLAVGVIIGAAFGKIVTAVVDDLIMPPIGKVVGNLNFSNLYLPLSDKVVQEQAKNPAVHMTLAEASKVGPVLAWGDFLTVTLNFLIVAFCIFLMIKAINALVKKEEAAPPPPSNEEKLLTEIRDLLKNRQ